jgi:hypothetical protein
MTKRVKDELEGKLMGECEASGYVSLALEGWSDPRGRRYQGVTVRVLTTAHHMLQTETHLLALDEIKTIHESAEELKAIIARVRRRYGRAICLNVCSDRGSLNIKAFRNDIHPVQARLDGQTIWFPCICHIWNNILNAFFKSIGELLAPIFRIQRRFRKSGRFETYLIQHHSRTTVTPSTSMVRWYSSDALLRALLELWPLMPLFQEQEGFAVPEPNDGVRDLIGHLRRLTEEFCAAQHELETDNWAGGSNFISRWLAIRGHIGDCRPFAEEAVTKTLEYMAGIEAEFDGEWGAFTLTTFLNPSLQWITGQVPEENTCSESTFTRLLGYLFQMVEAQSAIDLSEPDVQPPLAGHDHTTYRATAPSDLVPVDEQIRRYLRRRTSGTGTEAMRYSLGACSSELGQLARVAIRILSMFATPASAERSFSVCRSLTGDYEMA